MAIFFRTQTQNSVVGIRLSELLMNSVTDIFDLFLCLFLFFVCDVFFSHFFFQHTATFNKNTLKYLKIKHIKLPQTLPMPLSSQLSLAKVISEMKERKDERPSRGKEAFNVFFQEEVFSSTA